MLGYMLAALAAGSGEDWSIRSAGTHVVEGRAMSSRTRDALLRLNVLGDVRYGLHRGHQLSRDDVEWSDVILACAAEHVSFVRTQYPEASVKTVTLGQLLREASIERELGAQIVHVASRDIDVNYDLDDPAGGSQAAYDLCAVNLWEMAQAFAMLSPLALDSCRPPDCHHDLG
jgi:protein-tyrosine-phosphatase